MSSIPGLPTQGSDVTVLITRVHLHPLCVLVEFWGKFSQERITNYEALTKDIQSPGATFKDLEGNPGDQCLAQVDGTWYRSRIVSKDGSKYSVFLIDKGITYTANTSKLAWGKKEHFQLPPEVEFCVMANVLPLSPENRWSPVALEFLKSLPGKFVAAHVQDVLVPHRTVLLHIPCISKQMYEMGFAKKLSPVDFQEFVLKSLKPHGGAETSPEIQQLTVGSGERLHKQDLFMYPELPGGTVEMVVVTEVTNPLRIFCQLKVFSQELKKLSVKITQNYEGRVSSCIISHDMIGFPCAARGSDGKWYRSVLQQVFPTNKLVEVLNVDYGTKQVVPVENVRPLAAEFFRMPVVTYMCSLHGVIDKGVGWTSSQIDFLRSLLLCKTVIAKFEYQSISEGVYYVTLYGDDNANLNTLFGSKENCLLECEKTLGDYAIRRTTDTHHVLSQQEQKMLTFQLTVEQNNAKTADKSPYENLALNSSSLAIVEHISNPSEFWIQTENHKTELDELFESMRHLYQDSTDTHMVKNPTLGLYCAAQAEDGEFYRATVTELSETQVTVFFVDYGNTEVVDKSNIKTLPPEFKKLPQLALKCSLAGVRPKDGKWSQSALDFFIQAVTNKELNVHVKAKNSDSYVVQLTDSKAQGKQDVGTQMCSLGLAERAENQRQTTVKSAVKTAVTNPTRPAGARLPGDYRNTGTTFQCPLSFTSSDRGFTTFKEYMFPIGSVLDVSVSCIESPNDFWCQLVQNAGHLKLLMHDLQTHYAGSEFEPNVEIACVARHPDNEMWYRALVIHKHETPHVDVLFVDYGQTRTVSVYDLRRIGSEYLTLQGQAFRCSLLNSITPTSAINEWNEDAKVRFQTFVETAASKFIILKCTIYAIMYSEQMIVYNIVDLETPFESICTSMANLVTSVPSKKAIGPSFRMDTYYFSTHNVKTGAEEQVTVTYVNSVNHFYCHLDKNADVTQDLQMKVNSLCQHLGKVKFPTVFGTLCFARYTDGQWYRAQIKTTRPAILVHFVDYGDTVEVDKSDLLPIPKEANDIMSVPVQAVLCGLSDIPANVSSDVNEWFETTAAECQFRALIVAREPDGKLLVELYHGNTQINAKIKREFQIAVQTEKEVVYQGRKANHAQKTSKAFPNQATDTEDHKQAPKKNNFSAPKPLHQIKTKEKPTEVNQKLAQKPPRHLCENGQKIRAAPLELYKPPHQRQSGGAMVKASQQAADEVKPKRETLPLDAKHLNSQSPETKSQRENHSEKLPKLSDLPPNDITPGVAVDVYVSHCNSPLSFYVQCVSKEDEIFSLVEKLNASESTPDGNNIRDVRPGDLIQAEFEEDSSWYRAVVKEIHRDGVALVEFVDFGNTAVTSTFKMDRLPTSLLQLPVYSTHCMLSDAAALGEERVLNPEVVSAFKEDIGCCGEKVLKCHFISQVGSVWEVSLEHGGVDIVCKVPSGGSEITMDTQVKQQPAQISDLRQEAESPENSPVNPCSLRYPQQQDLLEGRQLEAYIAVINDGLTFYCQYSDSEELNKITLTVSQVGNTVDKRIDPDDLSPGSPCIALFSDDHLWYRAEVISKNGEKLSVLFVDYGNMSQVSVTDVRETPPLLVETPPQAFLCELEGFDASCGSWDCGAEDKLSTLTLDKLLKLTVSRVTRSDGNIKCFVHMDCEDQAINEVMKTWWKCCTTADTPESEEPIASSEPPPQPESTASVPEEQLKHPDMQDVFKTSTCIHPQSEQSEKQSGEKLTETSTADEVLNLAGSPKPSERSEDSAQLESLVQSMEEEQKSTEGGNIVPDIVVTPEDILPCDGGTDEQTYVSVDNKDEQEALFMSCKGTVATGEGADEESTSVVQAHDEDGFDSPLKENISEPIDELDTETADTENTSANSSNNEAFSAPTNVRCDRQVAVSRGNSSTTVKLVPRYVALQETTDATLNLFEEAELVPSSLHLPVQVCALLEASDTAIGEEHSNTISSPETAADREELTCCVEETRSADLEEPCVHERLPSEAASCVITEEISCDKEDVGPEIKDDPSDAAAPAEQSDQVQNKSVETCVGNGVETREVAQQLEVSLTSVPDEDDWTTEDESSPSHDDQLLDLPDDSEPQTHPDLSNVMEELTSLVGDIHLSDISRDSGEAETTIEDCDEHVPTSPQNKDLEGSLLTEQTSSSAEDSFEAQLSKITQLSSAVLLAEQQPEE
ncbi:tudor domain-containing 6 [Kryptolebias marmoratus]|uniref:tudor domain-containing 6 n=1 Tax=Kryptolebias marmoratus TaxID=37003 RepID=UPI0007F8D9F8|nr:tudor domain-containing 6 [Kryptolebias marmoratus]XP_024860189.1 tudor domain-containing 6 [Kryptolebias marmoratus]